MQTGFDRDGIAPSEPGWKTQFLTLTQAWSTYTHLPGEKSYPTSSCLQFLAHKFTSTQSQTPRESYDVLNPQSWVSSHTLKGVLHVLPDMTKTTQNASSKEHRKKSIHSDFLLR